MESNISCDLWNTWLANIYQNLFVFQSDLFSIKEKLKNIIEIEHIIHLICFIYWFFVILISENEFDDDKINKLIKLIKTFKYLVKIILFRKIINISHWIFIKIFYIFNNN
jgi:hypothetical protein